MNPEKKLKILMLEDSEDDAALIERVIRKENISFITERVDSKEEYLHAISTFQPDIVLSDHGLPQFNSREALKICLKERPASPFILVTGTVSDEYAISCLHEGADDYILKSNLSRLPAAMLSAVKKRRIEKLKREARHALRKQNQELQKVNIELDKFVYSVSHNLRGPLASVSGLLNLAKQDRDIQSIQALHSMMESSISKMEDTLKDILEFARNARNDIKSGAVNWTHMLNGVFTKLEYLDRKNKVAKLVSVTESRVFFSDESRLLVILTNLISNAIRFSDPHCESIVSVEITVDSNAKIVIKDNGIGISEAVIPRIFEMFYRGSEESQGAGLGLYIVKEIVSKLKGTIAVFSELERGSVFTVIIPNMNIPSNTEA